ncbi:MAG: (2Fe-2S)-binding protein [Polyangiaceae bacterium]|jgi:NADH-quinone oxidoreductase subunit G|nr:(2Fe-2S)-binding protein [Polyangiaceae bacterium]
MTAQAPPPDAPKPPNTIKIDGREIPFEPGDTIIRAAHRAGIDIPHYCWHPGLSVAANCRMCLVELPPPAGRPAMKLDVLQWDPVKKDYTFSNKPKLQPACQQGCSPGMEVLSESSKHVADARAAVQELLLLNHPVDCPICDQAGECRLQDYWLEHSRKGKRMKQEVVHKPKAVSFGPTIVYDAERCIVCTRCVRFCDEIAKDPVLDVRERGNLNEITVSPGRQLDNNYTLMTEHVCPVGALTSKDFRFKARVWFLRTARTICQGCSTGCNAYLDFDPRSNAPHRHRPRDNKDVNQYWMCDLGMLSYKDAIEGRLLEASVGTGPASIDDAISAAKDLLGNVAQRPEKVAVILSAQHSLEDNWALFTLAKTYLGVERFFVTGKPLGKGDEVLLSEDRNPNTAGVLKLCEGNPPRALGDLLKMADEFDTVLALGGHVEVDAKELGQALKGKKVVVVSSHVGPLSKLAKVALPACSWAETDATFVNKKGRVQSSERALHPRGSATPGWQLIGKLGRALGFATSWRKLSEVRKAMTGGEPASISGKQTEATA